MDKRKRREGEKKRKEERKEAKMEVRKGILGLRPIQKFSFHYI